MNTELKPCPFCGCDDMEGSPWPSGKGVFVCRCGNPDCNADIRAITASGAIARWNQRTPEQPA